VPLRPPGQAEPGNPASSEDPAAAQAVLKATRARLYRPKSRPQRYHRCVAPNAARASRRLSPTGRASVPAGQTAHCQKFSPGDRRARGPGAEHMGHCVATQQTSNSDGSANAGILEPQALESAFMGALDAHLRTQAPCREGLPLRLSAGRCSMSCAHQSSGKRVHQNDILPTRAGSAGRSLASDGSPSGSMATMTP